MTLARVEEHGRWTVYIATTKLSLFGTSNFYLTFTFTLLLCVFVVKKLVDQRQINRIKPSDIEQVQGVFTTKILNFKDQNGIIYYVAVSETACVNKMTKIIPKIIQS